MNYNYKKLLARLHTKIPQKLKDLQRFEVPNIEIFHEGNSTIIKNFSDVANVLHREGSHIFTYLIKELGTSGNVDSSRVIFKGKLPIALVDTKYKDYIKTYVLCSECKKPDTHFEKIGKVLTLKCDACGAVRPIPAITLKK